MTLNSNAAPRDGKGKRVDGANSERKQKQRQSQGQDTGPLPYLGWVGREDFYRARGSEKKRLIHAKPSFLFILLFLFIFNVDSKLHCSHLHHWKYRFSRRLIAFGFSQISLNIFLWNWSNSFLKHLYTIFGHVEQFYYSHFLFLIFVYQVWIRKFLHEDIRLL